MKCHSECDTYEDRLMFQYINMVGNGVKPLGAIFLALLMTISSPVAAQDYEKGSAAYEAGDYATALQEWMPLAEAGDANAQFRLGFMHYLGKGVPKDYADAGKWYRLVVVSDGDKQCKAHAKCLATRARASALEYF